MLSRFNRFLPVLLALLLFGASEVARHPAGILQLLLIRIAHRRDLNVIENDTYHRLLLLYKAAVARYLATPTGRLAATRGGRAR